MERNLNRDFIGIIILAFVLINTACPGNSNTNLSSTSSPTATPTPPITRGCPAGTKACGDACIPEAETCGGENY